MKSQQFHKILTWCVAGVWIANGLFCKVLNFVPRHEEIVARILGNDHSRTLTLLIGIAELFMAIWILSRLWPKFNAIAQIIVVAAMNVIEYFQAPDLLLWGKFNSLYAFLFIVIVFWNEFYLSRKPAN